MSDFWNKKFSTKHYLYGTNPNGFIKEFIDNNSPRSILFPAEGEGRNAVYAARKGWKVTAFDTSTVAKEKALNLANVNNVSIDYLLTDIDNFNPEEKFDVIAISYFHLYENARKEFHKKLVSHLRPSGYVILECYSKEHSNTSGPDDIDMRYDLDELITDFHDFEIEYSACKEVIQNEGVHHQGKSNIIQIIAKKLVD